VVCLNGVKRKEILKYFLEVNIELHKIKKKKKKNIIFILIVKYVQIQCTTVLNIN
jgi:hypothetical protein